MKLREASYDFLWKLHFVLLTLFDSAFIFEAFLSVLAAFCSALVTTSVATSSSAAASSATASASASAASLVAGFVVVLAFTFAFLLLGGVVVVASLPFVSSAPASLITLAPFFVEASVRWVVQGLFIVLVGGVDVERGVEVASSVTVHEWLKKELFRFLFCLLFFGFLPCFHYLLCNFQASFS